MKNALYVVKVARKVVEAVDICSFELVDPDGGSLPPFSAGAHIDVQAPGGLLRQYSLCNDPQETGRYLIGVLRDAASRGGSVAMHDQVREGDSLHISAPKDHFSLVHGARRSLLLAGGIGVTPILCMAERLAAINAEFEMHYCTRSRSRTAFVERIERSTFAASVRFHFDDGDVEQRLDIPSLLSSPDPDTHLYVCGPTGFLTFVLDAAKNQGWSGARIHYEYFGAPAGPADADNAGFDVKVASTGRVYRIEPDKSIVAALAGYGVEIPVSCEQGVCGTCITRVIAGVPDHRDVFFTDQEHAKNDQLTPCCSRAKSPLLILDL